MQHYSIYLSNLGNNYFRPIYAMTSSILLNNFWVYKSDYMGGKMSQNLYIPTVFME